MRPVVSGFSRTPMTDARRKYAVVGVVALFVSTASATQPGLPSKTAVWAAAARAVGAKNPNRELRNPDNFAIQFLGPRERALLSDYPMNALDLEYEAAMQQLGDKLPVKSHAFRTKAFDDAMLDALKAGARQVVVLGAGFDSRGYRFQSQLTGIRFIEVDQAATQDDKRRRVAEILGTPANVAYVPMDFTKDNLLDQLRKGGYSEQQQTFFLWEGVVFYLPESAVKETLHFVRDHAAPGSRLAFNYTFSTDRNVNNPDSLYSKWRAMALRIPAARRSALRSARRPERHL